MTNKKTKVPTADKKKRGIGHWLINILLLLMLVVGLLLVFSGPIKNKVVKNMTKEQTIETMTPKKIKQNQKKEANFDFDSVESISLQSVAEAVVKLKEETANSGTEAKAEGSTNETNADNVQFNGLGGIAIPAVGLNLPIFKGVSNYSLIVGAGTMKEDQQMGHGNYALASHHMLEPELLFGPLLNVSLGQSIYLTDLDYVYQYDISYKEYVAPNRTDLIEDVDDETLLTLVTCDATGANRLVVQAKYVGKNPMKKAPEEAINTFNIKNNNYE